MQASAWKQILMDGRACWQMDVHADGWTRTRHSLKGLQKRDAGAKTECTRNSLSTQHAFTCLSARLVIDVFVHAL